jgi:hypothetical protein
MLNDPAKYWTAYRCMFEFDTNSKCHVRHKLLSRLDRGTISLRALRPLLHPARRHVNILPQLPSNIDSSQNGAP